MSFFELTEYATLWRGYNNTNINKKQHDKYNISSHTDFFIGNEIPLQKTQYKRHNCQRQEEEKEEDKEKINNKMDCEECLLVYGDAASTRASNSSSYI